MKLGGARIVVTGGAGFIGSFVTEALVAAGASVVVVDNLSSGDRSFLADVESHISFIEGDVLDDAVLDEAFAGADAVWHLAANPEVRTGETDPQGHFDQNVVATQRVLEAMRRHGVENLMFTSTSTVYGEATVRPTPESYGPMLPISVYGGAKLACEGLISAYCGTFGWNAVMVRFANVVGPRSTHGVTFDFVRKLRADESRLEILGDGTQTKSYVSVQDTVAGMLHAARHVPGGCHPYNIGSLDAIPVTTIGETVASVMGLTPAFSFTGGTSSGAGWRGDIKHMSLDVDALQNLGDGWEPTHSSAEAIHIAAEWLAGQVLPAL